MSIITLGTPLEDGADRTSINDATKSDWDLASKGSLELDAPECDETECLDCECDNDSDSDSDSNSNSNSEMRDPEYFLKKAITEMQDRSATYDSPGGERSIANTVAAFNLLTNSSMKSSDGWLFMCLLKLVRANSGGKLRSDSFVDGAAYLSLYGSEKVIEAEKE